MNFSTAIVTTRALLILGGEDMNCPLLWPTRDNTLDIALLVDNVPVDAGTITRAIMAFEDSTGTVIKSYDSSVTAGSFVFTTSKVVNGVSLRIVQFVQKVISLGPPRDLPVGYYSAVLTTYDASNPEGLTWQPFTVRVAA